MKKTRSVVFLIAVLGVAVVAASAPRHPQVWKILGRRTVTDRIDHDVIRVTGDRGKWTAIKISVARRAVEFHKVLIRYGDGTVQQVGLKSVIPAGGSSRVIDLKGGRRVINRIEFWYDAESLGGSATVTVVGRR
jgi:hypothetical protein